MTYRLATAGAEGVANDSTPSLQGVESHDDAILRRRKCNNTTVAFHLSFVSVH